MSKGFFWPMFKRAWDKSFTEKNIKSAFAKAGIWPTDGKEIIQRITRPSITLHERTPGALKTPKSSKAIRRFQAAYDKSPTAEKVKTLFTTTLHLSAQVSCLQAENRGLEKAIALQKKKTRQGVRLNLAGQPNKHIIDCYSPAHVVKCREYQEEKEAMKIKEEEAKLQRKIQRAANALRKAQETEERAKRRVERQAKAAAKKLEQAAKKALKKQPNSVAPKAKKAPPTVPKARKVPVKAKASAKSNVKCIIAAPVKEVVASGVVVVNRSGRAITRPQRYN
jgi:hypothetical protein